MTTTDAPHPAVNTEANSKRSRQSSGNRRSPARTEQPDGDSEAARPGQSKTPRQVLAEFPFDGVVLLRYEDEYFTERFLNRLAALAAKQTVTVRWGDDSSPLINSIRDLSCQSSLLSRRALGLFRWRRPPTADAARVVAAVLAPDSAIPDRCYVLAVPASTGKGAIEVLERLAHVTVTVERLQPNALKQWALQESLKLGLVRDGQEAADKLVDEIINIAVGEPRRIAAIMEHLALALPLNSEPEVGQTLAVLKELFVAQTPIGDFELLERIEKGDASGALALATSLLQDGKSPFVILSTLVRSYRRRLALVYLDQRRASEAEMAQVLGLSKWALAKQMHASKSSRASDAPTLRRALALLARADGLLKSRSLGPDRVLEEVCFSLARLRR